MKETGVITTSELGERIEVTKGTDEDKGISFLTITDGCHYFSGLTRADLVFLIEYMDRCNRLEDDKKANELFKQMNKQATVIEAPKNNYIKTLNAAKDLLLQGQSEVEAFDFSGDVIYELKATLKHVNSALVILNK